MYKNDIYIWKYIPINISAHPKLDYDNRLKGVQNIKAGTTLSLPVNTSGIPNPTVTWLLDEEPVEKSARISIETVDDKTTLTIKNTALDDTGLYTVEAENKVGKAVAEFDVNVRGKRKPVYMCMYIRPGIELFLG